MRPSAIAYFKPNPYQLTAFKENIDLIHQSGAELILVCAPLPSFTYSAYSYAESSDSLFNSLGLYINFNHQMELDDSLHFYDATHLNQNGVKIFNDSLIKHLLKVI